MTEASTELLCPDCGAILETHKDDTGVKFYKCTQCPPGSQWKVEPKIGKVKNAPTAPSIKEDDVGKPLCLEHLNFIEDPSLTNKPVVVEAVVSSTSIAYVAPAALKVILKEEDEDALDFYPSIKSDDPLNVNLVAVSAEIKYKRLERNYKACQRGRVLSIEEKKWRTVYLVRVRPPVFTLEKRGAKIVDEKGFEYKSFDIYVTADKPITFEASCLIKMEGLALPNPKTQRITFLAYKVEFPEETNSFDIEHLLGLKSKFEGKSVTARLS